jgi:hypothetical protein
MHKKRRYHFKFAFIHATLCHELKVSQQSRPARFAPDRNDKNFEN